MDKRKLTLLVVGVTALLVILGLIVVLANGTRQNQDKSTKTVPGVETFPTNTVEPQSPEVTAPTAYQQAPAAQLLTQYVAANKTADLVDNSGKPIFTVANQENIDGRYIMLLVNGKSGEQYYTVVDLQQTGKQAIIMSPKTYYRITEQDLNNLPEHVYRFVHYETRGSH